MSNIKIYVDSCSSITKELIDKYNITVIPNYFYLNEKDAYASFSLAKFRVQVLNSFRIMGSHMCLRSWNFIVYTMNISG